MVLFCVCRGMLRLTVAARSCKTGSGRAEVPPALFLLLSHLECVPVTACDLQGALELAEHIRQLSSCVTKVACELLSMLCNSLLCALVGQDHKAAFLNGDLFARNKQQVASAQSGQADCIAPPPHSLLQCAVSVHVAQSRFEST